MNAKSPLLRPAAASLVVGLIVVAWIGWGSLHSQALVSGLDLKSGRNNFAVTLDFPPESFHVTRLQAIGRVIEVRDRTVYMMDVDTGDMRSFAAYYWVRGIATWPGR